MKGVPKDDDWRCFTQFMYDKINARAEKPVEIVTKMKAHQARLQQGDDADMAAMFSKLQMQSKKRNSKKT
jgi:hypothetical protein